MYLPFSLSFKVKEARFRYIALSHFSLHFKKEKKRPKENVTIRRCSPDTTDDSCQNQSLGVMTTPVSKARRNAVV